MKDNLDAIKKRIKKILALSKSPNENEADTALKLAQKLMEEYHLNESECLYERQSVPATKRLSQWRTILANAVARLYCCYTYRNTRDGTIIFYGDSFDVFMAGEMYRYLAKTVERMAKQNIRKTAKSKYRENYKLGIACNLYVRIQTLGAAASWAPERENKILAVKKSLESEIEVVSKDMKITGQGSNAFQKGAVAAKGISLNRQTTGHGGRYIGGGNGKA
ncbi:hypothetical protein FACS1894147_10800 [Spirochaetia bacterium]|nr:hypothetical protein FACS1894147_10800 [Spirochaetia bacterium]